MRLSQLMGFAVAALALSTQPGWSEGIGRIKICKQGNISEWAGLEEVWRRKITIPAGAVFGDVGPISDAVPSDEWWKLRIVTLASGSIRNNQMCVSLPAKVSSYVEDWGKNLADRPLVVRVTPQDKRLFEILRFALPDEPRQMAPWADVVPVEATVQSPLGK